MADPTDSPTPSPAPPPSITALTSDLLELALETSRWHASLARATEGLSAEQAAWRPPGTHVGGEEGAPHNCIHDIVRHLTHWKELVLTTLEPGWTREQFRAHAARDWPPDWPHDGGDWERDRRALLDVSAALADAVAALGDDGLAGSPAAGGGPRWRNLMNLATHDAYHAGQIRLLRALQGID